MYFETESGRTRMAGIFLVEQIVIVQATVQATDDLMRHRTFSKLLLFSICYFFRTANRSSPDQRSLIVLSIVYNGPNTDDNRNIRNILFELETSILLLHRSLLVLQWRPILI